MNWDNLLEEIKQYHIRAKLDESSLAMLRETCKFEHRASSAPPRIVVTQESVRLGYSSIVSLLLSRVSTRYLGSGKLLVALEEGHPSVVEILWTILTKEGWGPTM